MRILKTVTVGGLTWHVLSANERTTTHAGRHFFAVRCNSKRPWRIDEHDCDISQTGSAKPLRAFTSEYSTADLSQSVHEICGAPLEHYTCPDCFTSMFKPGATCTECGHPVDAHPSMPFEQYRAQMMRGRMPA